MTASRTAGRSPREPPWRRGNPARLGACVCATAAALTVPWAGCARHSHAADPAVVVADNDFGFRLFRRLTAQQTASNVVISPASIALVLQMAYIGARGDTQRAMARALEITGLPLARLNEANAALLTSLDGPQASAGGSHAGVLRVANALFVRHRSAVRADFVQRATQFYGAHVDGLGGAPDNINRWASEATDGRIPTILEPDDVDASTVAVLVNAVYLKTLWQVPFGEKETMPHFFTRADTRTVSIQMMHRFGSWAYLRADGFQAVRLPCRDGRLEMAVFLPDKGHSPAGFLAKLTGRNWQRWSGGFRPAEGTVGLPRLECGYGVELRRALRALGMGVAFDSRRADFSGVGPPPLWISRVRHKSFWKVNEQGMEAAAAAAVVFTSGKTLLPSRGFQFIADRPYFLAITDRQTGAILFLGAIRDPTAG